MKAATVTSFGTPPEFVEQPEPSIVDGIGVRLDVLAVGLHPVARAQADGLHYTSARVLPFVPGIDGVGRDGDGVLRYFVLLDAGGGGAMAERVVVNVRHTVPLPAASDPVAVAATMNPAMSAWLALCGRTRLGFGQDVLVLGATGSSGRMAVRIAALLGARRVVAAGRDPDRLAELPALGATDVVPLGEIDALGDTAADVDVVLDYVWGPPTAAVMAAVATRRRDPCHKLTWVEIGSVAGADAPLLSAALRSCRIEIIGSGRGSLSVQEIIDGLTELAGPVAAGDLVAESEVRPLADIAQAWLDAPGLAHRIVLVSGPADPGRQKTGRWPPHPALRRSCCCAPPVTTLTTGSAISMTIPRPHHSRCPTHSSWARRPDCSARYGAGMRIPAERWRCCSNSPGIFCPRCGRACSVGSQRAH